MRYLGISLIVAAAALAAPSHSESRTVGRVIDDTAITAEIKARLAADRLSNLTRIEVRTDDGIVTLSGVVDEQERVARAAQIASSVGGVKGIVNRIHVSGTTIAPAPVVTVPPGTPPVVTSTPAPTAPVVTPPAVTPSVAAPRTAAPPVATPPRVVTPPVGAPAAGTPPVAVTAPPVVTPPVVTPSAPGQTTATPTAPAAAGMSVDATGVVASVDRAAGTITLQDGRVVRLTDRTIVWQPIAVDTLRPGARVYVREAAPAPMTARGTGPEWRMGTVRVVDRTTNQVVLTDGTIVRVTPNAVVRRGSERLLIDQILPGSEIVVRTVPRTAETAEGSALPGTAVTTTIDAAELNVVWTPVNGLR
jgi:hypothetical protein